MVADKSLHLPALSKGETWHIEPISTSAGGSSPSSPAFLAVAKFQPTTRSGLLAGLTQVTSRGKQQSQRSEAISSLRQQGLTEQGAPADRRRLQQAAREVEAIFLEQLFTQMRSSLVDPISPTHQKLRGYLSMADQQLARSLAAGGGLGLANRIIKDLASLDSHPHTEKRNEENTPAPGKIGAPAGTQPV